MLIPWLWLAPLLVACSADQGSSLRGAVEALQRRQRDQGRGPVLPPSDYDSLYEFIPPGYPEAEYPVEIENVEDKPYPKYIIKLVEEPERPINYEYKLVKKNNFRLESTPSKESAFRERSHHSDNDRLRDLFTDRNEDDKKEVMQDRAENDPEYDILLNQLLTKYKNNKVRGNAEFAPPGVVKLYKEKVVKKSYPNNWGPIAFKRKRSRPNVDYSYVTGEIHNSITPSPNSIYKVYDAMDDDKDSDPNWRGDYAIAFQPLDDDSLRIMTDNEKYTTTQKRFPVTKRSSGPYFSTQKRFTQEQTKTDKIKAFRSSTGTDPKIIKDLSKIFGHIDVIRTTVKRNVDKDTTHESKPPQVTIVSHNYTQDRNASVHDDNSHEQHGHSIHHPGISGKEDHAHNHNHDHDGHDYYTHSKPITLIKKSIDWSDYFGIDKRTNKVNGERLKNQYTDLFNNEVFYPTNPHNQHITVKRNYEEPSREEETTTDKQDNENNYFASDETNKKLDNLEEDIKDVEKIMVDAINYSVGEKLDTKEEQDTKEQMIQKLAAAYSLEKMRKALKEFKQNLQIQRMRSKSPSISPEETISKRTAVKKEKVGDIFINDIPVSNLSEDENEDFEGEQGAGHYLNGEVEKQYSEGYMEGSGRHLTSTVRNVGEAGVCPVLTKIMHRCRGVDSLAGDHGQLFFPLCSLHQICYLCGEAQPTTCDLIFLSEADTACKDNTSCQIAARSALMALQELHDRLADEMDGECDSNPCLKAMLKVNAGWQSALYR